MPEERQVYSPGLSFERAPVSLICDPFSKPERPAKIEFGAPCARTCSRPWVYLLADQI